ncbi:MAG: ROK family protein [Chloroflexota bacterium]
MQLYGAVEAGGTKFICAVAAHPADDPVDTLVISTTTPSETIAKTVEFFSRHDLKGLGVASFGPVDLHPKSPTYGYITATPKVGWANTDLLGPLRQMLNIPIGFDTDVNGAALGEWRYGGGQGADSVVYITVGTGIGGGAVIEGRLLHGLMHPEMGHLLVRRHPDDNYAGHCPYHQDCLEGMACGPALAARWGKPAGELLPEHQAWEFEAHYLAQAISDIMFTLSPQRVILGGGVMHQQHLFSLIRQKVVASLNGYIQESAITEHIDTVIIPPGLGDRSGAVGALVLAQMAAG